MEGLNNGPTVQRVQKGVQPWYKRWWGTVKSGSQKSLSGCRVMERQCPQTRHSVDLDLGKQHIADMWDPSRVTANKYTKNCSRSLLFPNPNNSQVLPLSPVALLLTHGFEPWYHFWPWAPTCLVLNPRFPSNFVIVDQAQPRKRLWVWSKEKATEIEGEGKKKKRRQDVEIELGF